MSSEWVNGEGVVFGLCSDDVKQALRDAGRHKELYCSGIGWVFDDTSIVGTRAYRCKAQKKRLCDEAWNNDLRMEWRGICYNGLYFESPCKPELNDGGWSADGNVPGDRGFDATDWKNSLERREDCPICAQLKDCTAPFTAVHKNDAGECICYHCKLPLSRHEKQDEPGPVKPRVISCLKVMRDMLDVMIKDEQMEGGE